MDRVVPILGVADVGASLEYFVEVLGFSVDAAFGGESDGPAYGIVSRGDIAIHVQSGWTPRAGSREPHETDAYVYVADADALLAELQGRGVVLYRDMVDNDYGMRDFCVATPDGLRIAFGSPLPT